MRTQEFRHTVDSIAPGETLKAKIQALPTHPARPRLEHPLLHAGALGAACLLCAGVIAAVMALNNEENPGNAVANPVSSSSISLAGPATGTASPAESQAAPSPATDPTSETAALEPSSPDLWQQTDIGVDMAFLDYASDETVIFHGYFGLFVYDLKSRKIIRSVDLKPIGCEATQGDHFCGVSVSADGNTVQLHPGGSKNMYVYTVSDNTLRETVNKQMEKPFNCFVVTVDIIGQPKPGYSYRSVRFGTGDYGYLRTSDRWTVGTLTYVRGDTVYEMFGGLPSLADGEPTDAPQTNAPKLADTLPAQDTLERFFRYTQEKDVPGMESLLVEGRHGIAWEIEKWEYFKVSSIEEITTDSLVQSYLSSGAGSASHPAEVKVFKVVFDVRFTGGNASGMSDGTYDWNYFVVKASKDAPWLIEDWGW